MTDICNSADNTRTARGVHIALPSVLLLLVLLLLLTILLLLPLLLLGPDCVPHQEQREAGHEALQVKVLATPIVILIHPEGLSWMGTSTKGACQESTVARGAGIASGEQDVRLR
jgi:hypothetical protein